VNELHPVAVSKANVPPLAAANDRTVDLHGNAICLKTEIRDKLQQGRLDRRFKLLGLAIEKDL
jgi:hypothetical protein